MHKVTVLLRLGDHLDVSSTQQRNQRQKIDGHDGEVARQMPIKLPFWALLRRCNLAILWKQSLYITWYLQESGIGAAGLLVPFPSTGAQIIGQKVFETYGQTKWALL